VRSGQALESKTDAPRVVNSLLHHLPSPLHAVHASQSRPANGPVQVQRAQRSPVSAAAGSETPPAAITLAAAARVAATARFTVPSRQRTGGIQGRAHAACRRPHDDASEIPGRQPAVRVCGLSEFRHVAGELSRGGSRPCACVAAGRVARRRLPGCSMPLMAAAIGRPLGCGEIAKWHLFNLDDG
jgi:hypothetical protein